ncbi:MAG: YkvI family membrane protein [Desulfocucumaceae bacterium]
MYVNSERWSIFKIIVLYIGSVIGAGFASGQEILQFFVVFEGRGLWGIALSTALFGCLGGIVMLLAVHFRTSNYTDVYRLLLGKKPGRIMDCLSMVMLPGGLVVMFSGGGAIFSEHLGLPGWLGTLLVAGVTMAVLSRGLQGVIAANAALVPLKVVAILLICIFSLIYTGGPRDYLSSGQTDCGTKINWAWSAVLYVSYNMVVPVAVLSSMGKKVSLREGVAGGVLGGIILGLAAGLVYLAGISFYPEIKGYEVPMLYVAGSLGPVVKLVLGILIWLAILTTAIADAHGFASRLADPQSNSYKIVGAVTVLLALPLSALKFSLLVGVLYPLFGYMGLILIFALLIVFPLKLIKKEIL